MCSRSITRSVWPVSTRPSYVLGEVRCMDDQSKWLRIADDQVDVDELMDIIRRRVAMRRASQQAGEGEDPGELAQKLYRELIADRDDVSGLSVEDCEILPDDYVIDWRIPVIGPIHALVRRVINAEIQRYLQAGLIRQSRLNRQVLLELHRLAQENRVLRERIDRLEEREPPVPDVR